MPPRKDIMQSKDRRHTRADVLKVLQTPMLVCVIPYGMLVLTLAVRIFSGLWGGQEPDWKACLILIVPMILVMGWPFKNFVVQGSQSGIKVQGSTDSKPVKLDPRKGKGR
jgi:hypothetical protein